VPRRAVRGRRRSGTATINGGADRRGPADRRRFAGAPPALQRDSEGAMR
jgi:hypothetical protein